MEGSFLQLGCREPELHALLCLVNFLEASQCVLVSFHVCKHWALKGLPSITAVLRQGSGGKFSSEAAAATSMHSVGKTGQPTASGFPSARQRAHSSPSCRPKEANPNCLWQGFSSFMFMMSSHVVILCHKLPASLCSRKGPLLRCFLSSFLAFSSFAFCSWKRNKKLCNVCLCLHHAEATLTSK